MSHCRLFVSRFAKSSNKMYIFLTVGGWDRGLAWEEVDKSGGMGQWRVGRLAHANNVHDLRYSLFFFKYIFCIHTYIIKIFM